MKKENKCHPSMENRKLDGEEVNMLEPLLQTYQIDKTEISGPFSADAFFGSQSYKNYDAILAMYHDQGHAPMKLVAFDTAVNVTLGLPIVRTSVDHGTAFDIAGTGDAKEVNLIHAVRFGARMANGRKVEAED